MLGGFLYICTCTCTIYCDLWPPDNTSCIFLTESTMQKMGFSDRWVQWIMPCVTTVNMIFSQIQRNLVGRILSYTRVKAGRSPLSVPIPFCSGWPFGFVEAWGRPKQYYFNKSLSKSPGYFPPFVRGWNIIVFQGNRKWSSENQKCI
jgi:hypothetical protein